MTDTAFTSSSDQTVALWLADLYRARETESFFLSKGAAFAGPGKNSIIEIKDEFIKEPGYQVKFDLLSEPAMSTDGPTAGVTNSTTLWGSEGAMTYYQEICTIFLMREGRRTNRYSNQLTKHDVMKDGEAHLKLWSKYTMDKMIFNVLAGEIFSVGGTQMIPPDSGAAETNSNIIYGGDASSEATIDDTDVFDTSCIDRAKESALAGIVDSTTIWKPRPVIVDGNEHYVCIIHPFQEFDLKQDERWISAQEHAGVRGSDNPIFKGSIGMWNGVIIYVHNYIRQHTDWGSAGVTNGATALFLGAQAGCLVKAKPGDWQVHFQEDDYKMKMGVAIEYFGGFVKTRFNSLDLATIAIKTAAKSHAVQTA